MVERSRLKATFVVAMAVVMVVAGEEKEEGMEMKSEGDEVGIVWNRYLLED